MTTTVYDAVRDIIREMETRDNMFEAVSGGCCCEEGCDCAPPEVEVSQAGVDWLERRLQSAIDQITHLPPVDDFVTIGQATRDVVNRVEKQRRGR